MIGPIEKDARATLGERLSKLSPAKRALLERRLREQHVTDPVAAASTEPRAPSVLSFAQERMWFLHQLEPDRPLYHTPFALHLQGSLNVAAIEHAIDGLLARHEVLRTRIVNQNGQPIPVPGAGCELEVVDLSGRGLHPEDDAVRETIHSLARRPFDLSYGAIRTALVRLAPDEHVLLVTLHHISSDASSVRIIHRELAELYSSVVERRPPNLPDLPIQYADYALRQRRDLGGATLDRQLEYWRNQLADSPAVLPLPTDFPRPTRQRFRGSRVSFAVPVDVAAGLRQLGLETDATTFMTLLAAFQVLLARYSGQNDICVGTPVANRDLEDVEPLVGYFVNTLVLRTRLTGEPTFRELLREVRGVTLEALTHQELPFERLVAELRPDRDLSHSPLFQVMLVHYTKGGPRPVFAGLTTRRLPVSSGAARYDLHLAINEPGTSFNAVLEYDCDLFQPATIERLASHFNTLLAAIAAYPDRSVFELDLLPEEERHRILVEWNDTQREFPAACLHELYEAQVARTPDAAAVIWREDAISYSELDRRADLLARHLQALGVGPDVPVALCLGRSPAMVVGALAVLKAGGAYVPLEPSAPRARLEFMLEDCGAPVIVIQEDLREQLPPCAATTVVLGPDGLADLPDATGSVARVVQPHNLAYIIYTSGSTGKPKGVCIEHHNAAAFIHWSCEAYTSEELAGVLASTSLSFDISVFELFAPLSSGGAIVLADDLLAFPELPRRGDVTLVNTVPSAIAALLTRHRLPPSVRTVNLVGERLEAWLVDRIYERGAVERVYDLYGPTETTVFATRALRVAGGPVTIGRPIANTKAYILDTHGQPVPIGVVGELHLSGAGVGRGYWRRPELTAERFVPDPFDPHARGRLYKTGDLARFRADGNIEFIGRTDYQVKLRGFRIELGEIESVLASHPGIRQAVVELRDAGTERARLVAYCECPPANSPQPAELLEFLSRQLPDYMTPAQFVVLSQFPRTPNGKVDRKALPADGFTEPRCHTVGPRDPAEAAVLRLWRQTLDDSSLGVTDNFFDAGGHSLLAVRLFTMIEQAFGRRLPLATLFEAPTPEKLARVLRDSGWKPPWSSLVPIQPAGARPPLFCVHGAKGNVLFYSQLAAELGPDQPLFALQSSGLANDALPATQIEETAAQYVADIQSVQPRGPYYLGGFCIGAYIALEMAVQLQQQGEEVALLVSFNTDGAWKTVRSFADGLRYHWRNLSRIPRERRVPYLRSRLRYRIRRIARGVEKTIVARWRTPLSGDRETAREIRIEEIHRAAAARYRPSQFQGTVVLVQAHGEQFRDARPFWSGLVGARLVTHVVPGQGTSVFRAPNVKALAEKLRPYLLQPAPR